MSSFSPALLADLSAAFPDAQRLADALDLVGELFSTGLYDQAGAVREAIVQMRDLDLFAEAWDDRAAWEKDEHYDLVAELFNEGSASLDAAHEAARAQRDDLYQVAGAWDQSVAQWRTAA